MVLDWRSNLSRLREVVRIMETPPHTKTLSQLSGELGFGVDGEAMCRLLVQSGLKTEAELQVYRKKARASLGGEIQ